MSTSFLRGSFFAHDFKLKDYLRLANIRESISSGTLSNLNQIRDYDWLKTHHFNKCKYNLDKVFGDQRLDFEIPLSLINTGIID